MTSRSGSRHQARILIVQALYSQLLTGSSVETVEASVLEESEKEKADLAYFKTVFQGAAANIEELDALIRPHLDRNLETVTPIEHCILRLGAYELLKQSDVPFQVILNEAIELNKALGTPAGFKYINGVLDKLARELRAKEVENYKKKR